MTMGVVRVTFHRVRKEYPDSLITKEMEPWQFKQRSRKFFVTEPRKESLFNIFNWFLL
jgi:hypothetical protein